MGQNAYALVGYGRLAHAGGFLDPAGCETALFGRQSAADPFFVDKVVDVVGLYHDPPEKAVVLDLDDLADLYDLNVRVAVQVTQAALPSMRARGWGRAVNITSLVTVGLVDRTAYGAAKAALEFCSRPGRTSSARPGSRSTRSHPARRRQSCSGSPTPKARGAPPGTAPGRARNGVRGHEKFGRRRRWAWRKLPVGEPEHESEQAPRTTVLGCVWSAFSRIRAALPRSLPVAADRARLPPD
jgi:NAD(P)-dependent dehydrogenase (short-subunit alcohol dehydrogenase family)